LVLSDGTTDITRTLKFGTPTDYEKECYTLVLKGQIALGLAVFPNKLTGKFLDSFARKALWEVSCVSDLRILLSNELVIIKNFLNRLVWIICMEQVNTSDSINFLILDFNEI
jgi:hypothetical protein